MQQAILLLEKTRDDRRIDLAARRVEGFPRFDLPPRVRPEGLDEQPGEEGGKDRHALPETRPLLPLQDLVDDREVRAVRDDQMIEALADTPFLLARLPVDLRGGELPEDALRLVGEEAPLGEHGGEVRLLEIVVEGASISQRPG